MTDSRPLVLVVEDEPQMRRLLRLTLESNGMRYSEATSVREAIGKLSVQPPDLIIADLALPDGEGLRVIRSARESSSVPIVVLSEALFGGRAAGQIASGIETRSNSRIGRAPGGLHAARLARRSTAAARNDARCARAPHANRVPAAHLLDPQGRSGRHAWGAPEGGLGTREARAATLSAGIYDGTAAQAGTGSGETDVPAHGNWNRVSAEYGIEARGRRAALQRSYADVRANRVRSAAARYDERLCGDLLAA
jgi:CheY-like chemotaxis protein